MSVIDYQICLARPNAGDETWTSISALGGSKTSRETCTCGMDYVSFVVNGATAFTDAAVFAYHATVRMRKVVDGVASYWFVGRVATIPRKCSGTSENYQMRIEGPWSWFDACTFRQPWAASGGGITKPRAILFCDGDGNRITTGAQIIEAVNFARAAGAPIATASSSTVAAGFTPPFDEQINIKVSSVIAKCLSFHPHAVTWFDYSQRDAVFHCATRTDLPAVSRSIVGRQDISISQRTDLQAPAVAICYDRSGSVDGQPVVVSTLDWAPVVSGESTATRDARLAAADVVWACYDLQGAQVTTVSQALVVEAFPSDLNSLAWWQARVPELSDYAEGDLSLSNGRRLYDSSLSNIVVSGEKQSWMSTVNVEVEHVRVNVAYVKRGTVGGASAVVDKGVKSFTLELRVTGASTGSNLYRTPVSVDEGEPVPTGIAAQMYAEWAQLHFQGSITFRDDDPPGDLTPGHSLNLSGGLAEWASMAAMVIRCSESVDSGETTVEFGSPDWVDIDSRVAFSRATRTRNAAPSRVWRTGLVSDGVSGPVATSMQRDGNVPAEFVRQLFSATGSVAHQILIDADAVSKSVEQTTPSVLSPREILVPFLDPSDSKLKLKPAQAICSEAYGDAQDLPGSPLSDSAPQPVGSEAAVGTATAAARADHVHAGAAASDATPQPVGAAGAAGTAAGVSRADHVHAQTFSASAPAAVAASGSAGSGSLPARADHVHALSLQGMLAFSSGSLGVKVDFETIHTVGVFARGWIEGSQTYNYGWMVPSSGSTDTPATTTPLADSASGAVGTPANRIYANADHRHPINVPTSGTPAVNGTGALGTAATYSRSDHVHPANVGSSTPVQDGTGAAGTLTVCARADHVHPANVGDDDPENVGTAADPGVSDVAARADHVHAFAASAPASFVDIRTSSEASLASAGTTSWTRDGTNGQKRTVLVGMGYYHTAAAPTLLCYYREEYLDAFGMIYYTGPIASYIVDTPTLETWGAA